MADEPDVGERLGKNIYRIDVLGSTVLSAHVCKRRVFTKPKLNGNQHEERAWEGRGGTHRRGRRRNTK